MAGHTSELKIRGKRFILLPKREFETLKRQAEVGVRPATRHKGQPAVAKRGARTRKAVRILDQWLQTEDRQGEAFWASLEADVALNRFRLRQPKD